MSEHDEEKQFSSNPESLVQQKRPSDEYGGVGKESATKNLVNPDVRPSESWLVQRWRTQSGNDGADTAQVHQAASHGLGGSATSLPHADQIQKSFGSVHDVSQIQARVGGPAAEACDAMGANAYATGNAVAFKESPNLHTAAHEAAHVIQQKKGVSLYGGVGEAGDVHEQHADAVADRVVRGESAADLLSAGSGGGGSTTAVQKEDAPKKPATDVATPAAKKNTVDVALTAIFHDVPGEAKNKTVNAATGKNALWFDPLTMLSNHPYEKKSTTAVGLVAGGQTTIDTFKAPVSEGDHPVGRGSISAELKYAKNRDKSFSVTVDGIPKKDQNGAEAAARKIVLREIENFGDIDEIQGTATQELQAKYPGVSVQISVKANEVTDHGRSTFYYKVRGKAGIELNVKAAPVGSTTTKITGGNTKATGSSDETTTNNSSENEKAQGSKESKDTWKKKDSSTETTEVEYAEKTLHTLEDYVKKTTTTRTSLASDLAETTVKEKHSDWNEHTTDVTKHSGYSDWRKESKATSEEGDKDKTNWAAKLQKGVKVAKKVTSIPYVDKIPGIGWLSRKIKGWELDLIDEGLGLFAETGKVHFKDDNLNETVNAKDGSTDSKNKDSNVTLKESDKTEVKRLLKEDFLSKTDEDWQRHMKEIQEVEKTYKSKVKKDSDSSVDAEHKDGYTDEKNKTASGEQNTKKNYVNQTATATWDVTLTKTETRPAVQATVFEGDAEVSNQQLPQDATEQEGKPTVPTKL